MNTIVGIHQPNFMPWLGYFYKIFQSDIFIFLDDVQIQKTGSSYTNRVEILIQGKKQYLTIPIRRQTGVQYINQTKPVNIKWQKKITATLQNNYAKATYFKKNKDFIFELINYKTDSISEYNIHFITSIAKELNFDTNFIISSELNIQTTSTQRLIDLVKAINGTTYLSGKGGDRYQDQILYKKNKINLKYNNLHHFEYPQLNVEYFIPGLSIIDAIFNIDFNTLNKNFFTNKNINLKGLQK